MISKFFKAALVVAILCYAYHLVTTGLPEARSRHARQMYFEKLEGAIWEVFMFTRCIPANSPKVLAAKSELDNLLKHRPENVSYDEAAQYYIEKVKENNTFENRQIAKEMCQQYLSIILVTTLMKSDPKCTITDIHFVTDDLLKVECIKPDGNLDHYKLRLVGEEDHANKTF